MSNLTISESFSDVVDPESARVAARLSIERESERMRALIVGNATAAEVASWAVKRSLAEQYRKDGTVGTMLAVEAEASGEGVERTVSRIEANASLFAQAEGVIAGWRRFNLELVEQPDWPSGTRSLRGVPFPE